MRFIKIFHLSSLDVVCGALVMQSFLWRVLVDSPQTWPEILVLGLSVWVYYLVDRQIDNLRVKASDPIHQFHLRYQSRIRIFISALLLGIGFLLPYLSLAVIRLGICLSICMFLYGLAIGYLHRFFLVKELFTSVLYASGLVLPSLAAGKFSWLLFGSLCLLALMNLTLFSWLEGKSAYRQVFAWLQVPMFFFLGGVAWQFSVPVAICFAIIQGIHVGIYYFSPNLQRRWVGELAFLSPLFYFVYELF
jgi:hypothetical protein